MPDSNDDRLLRLNRILNRSLRRASLEATAKKKLKAANRDKTVAEDYADRLAEKAKFRRLLASEEMDAWRFRWYFQNVQKDVPLDQLREWIDSQVAGKEAA